MKKIKLIQTVQVLDDKISYSDVLKTVNELKAKIQNELIAEGVENDIELIIDVKDTRNFISLRPKHQDLGDLVLPIRFH